MVPESGSGIRVENTLGAHTRKYGKAETVNNTGSAFNKKKKDNRAEVQGAEMLRETIMKGNCLGSWFSSSRPGFWDAYLNP